MDEVEEEVEASRGGEGGGGVEDGERSGMGVGGPGWWWCSAGGGRCEVYFDLKRRGKNVV